MRIRSSRLVAPVILYLAGYLWAQPWSGIIDPVRAIDWSKAGAGSIPTRSTICATLNPGATATQISNALAACPSGQVVFLNAGTYNLSAGITFNARNNVTLRGAGADKTILVFTGNNACGGLGSDICVINAAPNYNGNPVNVANYTAGYSKGTTVITLDKTTNIVAGSLLILDQVNDGATDKYPSVWVCGSEGGGVCCIDCASGSGRVTGGSYRQQLQTVLVRAVSGNQVTIEDPLYMPQWRSSQSPGAWWSSAPAISGSGIEDLSMDHTRSTGQSGVGFYNAHSCWLKGVRSINSNRNHVWLYQSAHITVRDSYFYGTMNATTQSYGVENYESSSNLIENNIFQHITAATMQNGGGGIVFGYNFVRDDYNPGTTVLSASNWHHGPGISYNLYEGNDIIQVRADYFHGVSHLNTLFRNRVSGYESGHTLASQPIYLQTGHRLYNIIGNVLGTAGFHNRYTSQAGDGGANCDTAIFGFGWGGFCGSGSLPDDTRVAATVMRWGNYDTVNQTSRFVSAEVPSNLSLYANAVPASQTLPPSFYLSTKPSGWWATPWGTPQWPAIGPDVQGGNTPNVGGHANAVPAGLCYTNSPIDPAFGSSNVRLFNADTCYGQKASPAPPSNLNAVVQ